MKVVQSFLLVAPKVQPRTAQTGSSEHLEMFLLHFETADRPNGASRSTAEADSASEPVVVWQDVYF